MKKLSNLKGVKILSRKEQNEINGSFNFNGYCKGTVCYVSLPNVGEVVVGTCLPPLYTCRWH